MTCSYITLSPPERAARIPVITDRKGGTQEKNGASKYPFPALHGRECPFCPAAPHKPHD